MHGQRMTTGQSLSHTLRSYRLIAFLAVLLDVGCEGSTEGSNNLASVGGSGVGGKADGSTDSDPDRDGTNQGGTDRGGESALGGASTSRGNGGATSAVSSTRAAGGATGLNPVGGAGGVDLIGTSTRGNGGAATGGRSAQGGQSQIGGAQGGGVASTSGARTTGGNSAMGGAKSTGSAVTGGAQPASSSAKGSGGSVTVGGASGAQSSVTIYLAGDSIVATYTDTSSTTDQAGWGQMLPAIFNSKVSVVNRAGGGRTAYWFYLEGGVDKILGTIKAGDYFFIEFGTNDQNTTATFTVDGKTYPRLAEPALFKTQLKQYYLDPAKAKGAIPVLVTPPPRNSAYCNGGNGLGAYATAMVELGATENVTVLDNNAKTFAYLKAICPKPTSASDERFFFGKSDGSIDGTHFQENGARKMAGFIGEEIKASTLGLSAYLL